MQIKDIDKIYLDLKNSEDYKYSDDNKVLEKARELYELQQPEIDSEDDMAKYIQRNNGIGYFDLSDFYDNLLGGAGSSTIYDCNDLQVSSIRNIIQYPVKHEKALVRASQAVYDVSQDYKTVVKIIGNLLRYAPIMNVRDDGVTKEEFIDNLKFIESFNYEFEFNKATKKAMINDVYFAYVVTQKGTRKKQIMEMPPEYCHLGGVDSFGMYYYYFDITYFDSYPEEIEFYPEEFQIKYERYKRDKAKRLNPSTYMLPRTKNQLCVKFDIVQNYIMPYFASSFAEMIQLDELKEQHFNDSLNEHYKLIHQRIPLYEKEGKKNQYLISGKDVVNHHNTLAKNVGNKANTFTSPMDLNSINLSNSSQQLINSPNYNFQNLYSSVGVSQLLANNDKAGSTGINANIMVNSGLVFTLLRQYEMFFNKMLYHKTKSSKYKVTMLNLTENNYKEMYDKYKNMAESGYSKFYAPACMQQTQLDVLYGLEFENETLDLVDKYLDKPLISSHISQQDLNINEGGDDDKSDEAERADDRE